MGKSLLLSAVLLVLFRVRGTNAARSYHPTDQELKNEISLSIRRFFDHVSPNDGTPGDRDYYFAGHWTAGSRQPASYYGVMVTMDVYGFSLNREQMTSSSILIINDGAGLSTSVSVIEIGWEVKPSFYGDLRTHPAGYWTAEGFHKTGCPNMICPGYQREHGSSIALGDVNEHVSQPSGAKQNITVKVLKVSGDWLVYYGLNQNPELIGRFPKSLFPGGLDNVATSIKLGGFVKAGTTDLAPMGSGHYPTPFTTAAASFSEITFIDKDGHATRVMEASHLPAYASLQTIYGSTDMADAQFFYGGAPQPIA